MNRIEIMFLPLIVSCLLANTVVAQNGNDPIGQRMVPVQVLLSHREELNLSEKQFVSLRRLTQDFGPRLQAVGKERNEAMRALAQLIEKESVDVEVAIKQQDKILAAERKVRTLNLRLTLQARNELTAEQHRKALKLHRKSSPQASMRQMQQRQAKLQQKMQLIQAEIQRRVQAGDPPHEAAQKLQQVPMLVDAGKPQAAEDVLDDVLKMLDLATTEAKKNREAKKSARLKPRKLEHVAKLNPDEILRHATAMKEEDVAWRKIAWKTCLIDGLLASKEQNKPVMLWVFIDRPIDDERC